MVKTPLKIQFEVTETQTNYRFILKPRTKSSLEFVLRDEYGVPYFHKEYSISVDGFTYEGNTGETGLISQSLPSTAQTAELTVWIDAEDPDDTLTYQLNLNPLPPITEIRGVQIRLNNLGYGPSEVTGELDDQTRAAIQDFQEFMGYDSPTGELNDQTRADLLKMSEGE